MIRVIGAGLAGCEAALQIADGRERVLLCEMKPQKYTPAHQYPGFAELICSNSLKAERVESAAGLLKAEMRLLGSVVCRAADETRVPAGGALAVDRVRFSDLITEAVRRHPNIEVVEGEVTAIDPDEWTVVASGPLTSDALSAAIADLIGEDYLSFYDAAAPIVTAQSLDRDRVFAAARYGRGDADYLNCPMNKEEYDAFIDALVSAERAPLHDFEQVGVYEGCMPVEVMAARGHDTLRFGPLRPVGLRDPATGHRPWAVVQLRKEDVQGSLYNLVGFQTNLKFPEQKRVFSLIPGLEKAEFMRYGVMHRNTFLNSPKLLCPTLCLRRQPKVFFAGQITGTEGYIESAAGGILAGKNALRAARGRPLLELPRDTMLGALTHYVSDGGNADFQPMGANMGVLPPLENRVRGKQERYGALAARALCSLRGYLRVAGEAEATQS